MVDKNLSMSSFLALRYTEKPGVDFTEKIQYRHHQLPKADERIYVHTAQDISDAIEKQLKTIRGGIGRPVSYSREVWIRQSLHRTCPVVTRIHSAF